MHVDDSPDNTESGKPKVTQVVEGSNAGSYLRNKSWCGHPEWDLMPGYLSILAEIT